MPRRSLVLTVCLAFLLAGCQRGEIAKNEWLKMNEREKLLVVESLRGYEQANERKGGGGRLHPRDGEWYRRAIDERYAAGDERPVTAIWDELVEEKVEPDRLR